MSYILDALKKLEHEKQKKARTPGMISLSGDLLQDSPGSTGGGGVWRVIVLVVAASVATFGVSWYVLKGGPAPKPEAHSAAPSSPVPAPPAPVPQPPAAVDTQAAPAKPAPPVQHLAAPPATAVSLAADPPSPVRRAPTRSAQPLQKSASRIGDESASPMAPPADIKVSGIAWQDERVSRRAVINGVLLKEGSTVAGARITEIRQDRVRFLQSGRTFEVSLVPSGMPAAAQ